jgi:hypothetical protein
MAAKLSSGWNVLTGKLGCGKGQHKQLERCSQNCLFPKVKEYLKYLKFNNFFSRKAGFDLSHPGHVHRDPKHEP